VSRVRGVGTALRSAGEQLREEDDVVAGYAEKASERIESIASYLDSAEPRELARDAEDLARTHPAWFFGGAFLVGLAAGRFLKASTESGFGGAGSRVGPPRRVPRSGMVARKPATDVRSPTPDSMGATRAMGSASVGVARTVDVPGSMDPTSVPNPIGRP
jgi:hypothetical protein